MSYHVTKNQTFRETTAFSLSASLFYSFFLMGCGGQARLDVPEYDPEAISQALLDEYDFNEDGLLSGDELQNCPSIANSMVRFDRNNDGAVSAEEIASRATAWGSTNLALMRLKCKFLLDGKPIQGAQVEFIPESCLSHVIKSASGTTSVAGMVEPRIHARDLPSDTPFKGTNMGLFKVVVTHPENQIPRKYNTETELGIEITKDLGQLTVFELQSE